MENIKIECKKEISTGNLKNALELLTKINQELAFSLTFRFNENKRKQNIGIINNSDFTIENNNICNSILTSLGSDSKKEIKLINDDKKIGFKANGNMKVKGKFVSGGDQTINIDNRS